MSDSTHSAACLEAHSRDCPQCRRAKVLSDRCSLGQLLAHRVDREIEMDQRAIDQRTGRTYAEIEHARKGLLNLTGTSVKWDDAMRAEGALLAIEWVLDDSEHPVPLSQRLLAEGRG